MKFFSLKAFLLTGIGLLNDDCDNLLGKFHLQRKDIVALLRKRDFEQRLPNSLRFIFTILSQFLKIHPMSQQKSTFSVKDLTVVVPHTWQILKMGTCVYCKGGFFCMIALF